MRGAAEGNACGRQSIGRSAAWRGRRSEVGFAADAAAPNAVCSICARVSNCLANLRPALLFGPLADASSLKRELVEDLDILIVRELTGGIYFGKPRGIERVDNLRRGFNTDVYDETEIARIGRVAFDLARKRDRRVCSVDKANVLEVTQLWSRS